MRVVMIVLDAFPDRLVSAALTPTIDRLARRGARHAGGGTAELAAATYPNHATFVTGLPTHEHGLVGDRVPSGSTWRPSWEVGPQGTTLFDACRREGRRAVAIVGDDHLIGACGLGAADDRWPRQMGTSNGCHGLVDDETVTNVIESTDLDDVDLLFVQLAQVDAVRHEFGAWSPEAKEQCFRTDAALDRVIDRLRPSWDETVIIVVSDHDQEDLEDHDVIDLDRHLPEDLTWTPQGTAAVVAGRPARPLTDIPGVIGATAIAPDRHVVWGDAGRAFGRSGTDRPDHVADHGSPRTAIQLAVTAGGHPAAAALASTISTTRPHATDWARWTAALLGLQWSPAASTGAPADAVLGAGQTVEP